MNDGRLQHVADTLLIEKFFLVDVGLRKEAGAFDGFLGGVANSVIEWGKEHIDTSSPMNVVSSLVDLMAPSVLFRINPVFGVLGMAAQTLGFSPSAIIGKIISLVKSKIDLGEMVSASEITDAGRAALSSVAGDMEASADFFDHLRQIEKRGLIREAQLFGGPKTLPDIPMFPKQNAGLLERIFGQLFQTKRTGKAKWLLGGFIIWIVKNVLLGAGLLAGGEAIKKLITGKNTPPPSQQPSLEQTMQESPHAMYVTEPQSPVPVKEEMLPPNPATTKLQPSGRGQDVHRNDASSMWLVPLLGDLESTLAAWAVDVYPELEGKQEELYNLPSFNRTVNEFATNYRSGAKQMSVPTKFKTRRQVVDQFAHDLG
jgi:hypothetical protein